MKYRYFLQALILGSILVPSVRAQDAPEATDPPAYLWKDPGTATLFSVLIPGGGQLYAGEPKGAAMLVIGTGALVAGYLVTANNISVECGSWGSCEDKTPYAPLYIGTGIYAALWLAGIIDASDAANRTNARNGFDVQIKPTRAVFAYRF